MRFKFLLFLILFTGVSCIRPLEPQFTDSNRSVQERVISLEELQKTECQIQTGDPVKERQTAFRSSAQEFVIEGEKPIINNFPFVEYTVKGSDICQILLGQKQLELAAQPHFSYPVHFQVMGSYLRLFIEGSSYHLPYQHLTSSLDLADSRSSSLIPIGGYSIKQGEVRRVKNVVNEETHILNFYPKENQPFEKQTDSNIPQWIQKDVSHILVSDLNGGFQRFKYQDKSDTFPKSYFEGVWYSGVSITSKEPLTSKYGMLGLNASGDSHSGLTSGQKIVFEFESNYLRAFNENYQKQMQERQMLESAEAEVLSFPIQHLDYQIGTPTGSIVEGGLSEEVDPHTPWQEAPYVKLDFSNVDHFYNKIVDLIGSSNNGLSSVRTHSVTVKEVRFADNYFDILVYDGSLEYRLSFLRKSPNSSYVPRTLSSMNHQFGYFYVPDKRIHTDSNQTFRSDYQENILIHRVNPDSNNEIVLNFSNLTPVDQKVRDIGREAINLWNQALEKAQVSFRLRIDESKDVALGDIRYHVLNLPFDLTNMGGYGPSYVDDETGEVIATSSTIYLRSIRESLKSQMIRYSYKKYGLDIQSVQTPQLNTELNLPLSEASLNFFNFKDKLNFIQNLPSISVQKNSKGLENYITDTKNLHQNILNHSSNIFSQPSSELAQDPLFKDWAERFKMNYVLQTGESIREGQPINEIRDQVRSWGLEKWDSQAGGFGGKHLYEILETFCPFISHPLEDRDSFDRNLEECVEFIYPVYVLGTTVHEIGHSVFSLFHNFAGSVDGENFNSENDYQIQFLKPYLQKDDLLLTDYFPQVSSTVMDYINISDGEQWTPGPYDVEAIRFLYSKTDEVEETNLSGNNSVDNSSGNSFLKCSEWDLQESSHCLQFDASSTPVEQARNIIENLFESLDYNFGRVYDPYIEYRVYYSVSQLMAIYYDWRLRLNAFAVYNKYDLNRISSLEGYQELIQHVVLKAKSPSASKEEQELLSFYKARNLIYHALTYFSFLPNRYCVLKMKDDLPRTEVQKDVRVFLEISKVQKFKEDQNYVLSEDIVSCWANETTQETHPFVQEYINSIYPDYELEDEKGYFLQTRHTPKNLTYQGLNPAYQTQYYGTFNARLMTFSALFLTEIFYPRAVRDRQSPFLMMNERDIEDGLERLVMARATKGMFFSESEDFFADLDQIDLETLRPKKSAELLFKFPMYREGEKDLVFKDDFIQLDKLQDTVNPYVRDDDTPVKFYQNFHEEKDLLMYVGQIYSLAKILAGGNYPEEIQRRAGEIFSNTQVQPSSTKTILIDKFLNYMSYSGYPEQATSYHFEHGPLYVTPAKNEEALDSISNILISELGLNAIREMMTPRKYLQNFVKGANGQLYQEYGFTSYIIEYLNRLLKFQNLRLGRFYFMYAYTLILGMLESYEETLENYHFDDPKEIHELVQKRVEFFPKIMGRLFYYPECPLVNNRFNINRTEDLPLPELRHTMIQELNATWEGYCGNKFQKRGKLQSLFTSQNYINHDKWAQQKRESLPFLPPVLFDFNQAYNQNQVYRDSMRLNHDMEALNQQINVGEVHMSVFPMFQNFLRIHENDLEETKKVVRFNRDLLLDVIPKIMLMYSPDRDFIGEMVYIVSNIYSQCTSEYQPEIETYCQLIIEKMLSYYFSGNVYGTDPRLESYYLSYSVSGGRIPASIFREGLPLNVLVQQDSNYFRDSFVNPLAFDWRVIVDYMFFKRNWAIQANSIDEVLSQREILFTLFPIVPVQVRSF